MILVIEQEFATDSKTGKKVVSVNPRYYRPAEVDLLIGDATKAKNGLNWSPTTSLEDLCVMMFNADITRNENGRSY